MKTKTKSDLKLFEWARSLKRPDIKVPYSVEFFHIYTDEKIEERHKLGLEYLKAAQQAWPFEYQKIVLIDNYNPTTHVLNEGDVFEYLQAENSLPDYWALEGDLVENAKKLLDAVTSPKLKKSYLRYIENHNKYPCSLLTATWYLTRLGSLKSDGVIRGANGNSKSKYKPAARLINLLPQDYKPVEERARELILKSSFSAEADKVQDLFYPVDSGRALDLF